MSALRSTSTTDELFTTVVVNPSGMEMSLGLGTASATTKKKAKDIAAEAGFDWLCSQFPSIDLSDI